MAFHNKLKAAMEALSLNQRQVCGLINKSKATVSYYVSGQKIPSEETQEEIAIALGLDPDYFKEVKEIKPVPKRRFKDVKIPELKVTEAASMMGANPQTIRLGLQQGVYPWGYAVHTSEKQWAYFINAKRFAEIEMVDLEAVV